MDSTYNVAFESRDVVVRFSREVFDRELLTKFLDFLELEAIRRRSRLTQAQADELAEEINRAGWQRIKSDFLQP
ncbi:MAG: hypothetical protein EYC68_06650 [Chloroflexota bacterium]|nr:MAG: hypothetical protein EYC68_06650 [Chloroflexota bacterium]